MGYNITTPLTVNGTLNLKTLLVAAGYQGPMCITREATLLNIDAAVICYLHLTDSNVTAPGTGTNGMPIDVAGSKKESVTLPPGTDLSTTWLHTPSSITVKCTIQN